MKRRRELAIELTPLLDVIMIMLFLILTQNAGHVKEAREQASEEMAAVEQQASSEIREMQDTVEAAKAEAEAAEEALSSLEGRVQSLEVFEEYSVIVSVQVEAVSGISGDGSEESSGSAAEKAAEAGQVADQTRKLIITCGEQVDTVSFNWSNTRYAENRLKEILKGYFDSASGMPCFVVFSYEKDKIYNNDFNLVQSVLSNMEGENIYIKIIEE